MASLMSDSAFLVCCSCSSSSSVEKFCYFLYFFDAIASSIVPQGRPKLGNAAREKTPPSSPRKWSQAKESSVRNEEKLLCVAALTSRGLLDANSHLAVPPLEAQRSTAPLVEALKSTAEKDVAAFHFPGHNRGKAAPSSLSQLTGIGTFLYDLPELPELDDLFSPKGAILDAQIEAAKLFGASETWFLVGGTTCGIQASILATCCPGDAIILPRNSHISAISGMILSGAVPKYILPEYSSSWDITGGTTKLQVEKAIAELEEDGKRAGAVLVTSPTYHGICSNLSEITMLCHSRGIPVIVDEAHGAHFRFHPKLPSTALEQGADLAVQSTHKVLCSLTQSSMLHMLGDLVDKDRISRCLQMLQSSSPSYLLLASLDAARAELGKNPDTFFEAAINLASEARQEMGKIRGVSLLDLSSFLSEFPAIDPLRITIGVSDLRISGYVADEILYDSHQIIPEMVGTNSLTVAINLGTRQEDVRRLTSGLEHLSNKLLHGNEETKSTTNQSYAPFADISSRLTPREAFFARKRKVSIKQSIGEISGELICPYPPGVPVLIPGELISEEALSYLMDLKNMGAEISGAADKHLSSILVCDTKGKNKFQS